MKFLLFSFFLFTSFEVVASDITDSSDASAEEEKATVVKIHSPRAERLSRTGNLRRRFSLRDLSSKKGDKVQSGAGVSPRKQLQRVGIDGASALIEAYGVKTVSFDEKTGRAIIEKPRAKHRSRKGVLVRRLSLRSLLSSENQGDTINRHAGAGAEKEEDKKFVDQEEETVWVNPIYKIRFPYISKGAEWERKIMNLTTCNIYFKNSKAPHGLNLDAITMRCDLRRQYSGDGGDFSNLVGMVRGTLYKLAQKKAALEALPKSDKDKIVKLETFIDLYEDSIEKSFLTISKATGVPVKRLRHLLPLVPESESSESDSS